MVGPSQGVCVSCRKAATVNCAGVCSPCNAMSRRQPSLPVSVIQAGLPGALGPSLKDKLEVLAQTWESRARDTAYQLHQAMLRACAAELRELLKHG